MKKVIQLILFLFLIIISIIFYKIYFNENEKPKIEINIQEEQSTVNSENNFLNLPDVINGASDLFKKILGKKGCHTRTAIGVNSLPLNASVEIDAIFLIK